MKEVSKPLVTVMLQVGREVVRELDLLSQAVYMGVEGFLQLLVVIGEHGTLVEDLLNLVLRVADALEGDSVVPERVEEVSDLLDCHHSWLIQMGQCIVNFEILFLALVLSYLALSEVPIV